jgi:hypothetical protein
MAYRSYGVDYLGEEEGYGLVERVENNEIQVIVTDPSVSAILKHVARHMEDTDDIYIPELIAEVLDIESSYKYNQVMSTIQNKTETSNTTQSILAALFNNLFKDISESTNRPGGDVLGVDELKDTQLQPRPEPPHDLEADVDETIKREYWERFQAWQKEQKRIEEDRNDNE